MKTYWCNTCRENVNLVFGRDNEQIHVIKEGQFSDFFSKFVCKNCGGQAKLLKWRLKEILKNHNMLEEIKGNKRLMEGSWCNKCRAAVDVAYSGQIGTPILFSDFSIKFVCKNCGGQVKILKWRLREILNKIDGNI